MTKTQKIWLWISIALFALPELLFFFILSLSGVAIKPLIYMFFNYQFFIDHQYYVFFASIVEWFGMLGLFILCLKLKKKILAIISLIALLILSLVLYLGYIYNTMSLVL